MKKILFIMITILFLTGCDMLEESNTKDPVCAGDQVLTNGVCVDEVLIPTCNTGEILVNNVCEKEVINCVPGFSEENGICVKDEEDLICEYDEIVVDGQCVDLVPDCQGGYVFQNGTCIPESEATNGPDYVYPDTPTYEGRDLVDDSCNHLDNIGEWQPVWCDEFDYVGLPDTTLWNYDVGGHGWGNGEAQYYTNADPDNAYVENGFLTITAIKESYSGSDYTSTRLISKDNGDWLYGKIQVRAKLPSGRGTWPAIWMLPTNWEYGGWPHSGEIDIMEYVGYDANRVHTTIHTGAFNHSIGTQVGVSKVIDDPENLFHVYEIEWEPGVIRTMINGVLWKTFEFNPEQSFDVENFEAWPFDIEFHLLLNIAVGGAWGGAQGIDDTIFPQEFVIDYVRVFQKDYAGMDQSAPNDVGGYTALKTGITEAYIMWDKAFDDVMVKEYEVYVDGTLFTTSSLNGYLINSLAPNTTYELSVIAVDFAGNKSASTSFSFTTELPPTELDRIESENYTDNSGISTESTSDSGGGLNIGWVDSGDWVTYDIEVTTTGTYTADFRIASPSGGTFDFYVDGTIVATVIVPITGDWQNWQTVTSSSFTLTQGSHELKIVFVGSGINMNYFEFN